MDNETNPEKSLAKKASILFNEIPKQFCIEIMGSAPASYDEALAMARFQDGRTTEVIVQFETWKRLSKPKSE